MAGRNRLLDLADFDSLMPQDLDPDQADAADPTAARLPAEDQQLSELTLEILTSGARLPLRAGIAMPEEELYHGRATSALEDEERYMPDRSDEGHQVSGRQGLEGLDEPLADRHVHKSVKKRARDGDDDDSSGLQTQEGEEDQGQDGGARLESGGLATDGDEEGNAELQALEAGYSALQAAEAKAVAAMQGRNRKEVLKGRAARNQQLCYEGILELRVLLQRALAASHRFPLPDTCSTIVQGINQQQTAQLLDAGQADTARAAALQSLNGLQQQWQGLRSTACDTLLQLMQLYDTIIAAPQSLAHGSIQEQPKLPQQPALGRRTSDEIWQVLDRLYNAFAPFRDASVDRWHARAILGSGSTNRHGATTQQLRALHQSTSRQVADMMAQQAANLIRRSRLPVGKQGHARLGEMRALQQTTQGSDAEGTADHEADYGAATQRDDETYDDGELYQQLLKEFLQQGGPGTQVSTGRPAKQRKLVDRRASKGRKIRCVLSYLEENCYRYNVQEKLVNFMSVVYMEPPVFAEQLFANLFGHTA